AFLLARFFIAGLFTYLFAKLLGTSRGAAFAAAVGYMFSGYFMLYVNAPQPDYAMLVPFLLYAFELLIQRPSGRTTALAAVAVTLAFLNGNPETTVLLIVFGTAYYLARVVSEAFRKRSVHAPRLLVPLGVSLATGAGLSAFVIVPFIELVGFLDFGGLSVNLHPTARQLGIKHIPVRTVISLFVPYFDGPPVQNFQGSGWTGIRNYVGLVIPLLGVMGLWNRPLMRRAGWFLAAAAVLMLAKTYGVGAVNWIGYLPVFNVIDFGLYLPPLIAFSIAIMAALGIDQVTRMSFRGWHAVLALAVLALSLAWLVWMNRSILDAIPNSHLLFYMAVALGLGTAATGALLATRWGWLSVRVAVVALIALISIELFIPTLPYKGDLGVITQELYGRHLSIVERPQQHDPFIEPPFVTFLKADKSKYRVFGQEDKVLYPDTSSVYGIDDIRGYTALTVGRYLSFIQHFVNPSVRQRFTGAPLPPLGSELEPASYVANPKFDLLNVKYVLAKRGLTELYDHSLADALLAANPDIRRQKPQRVKLDLYSINGEEQVVLFQHAPTSLSLELSPSDESRFLVFRLALDPEVWHPDRGDGVLFEVSVDDGQVSETVFSRWVDPKNDPKDRRWIDGSVDLSPYLGRPITLVLSTSPGESSAWDWAAWGDLRLAGTPEVGLPNLSPGQFELVYDNEVKIYRNTHALPRAFVVNRAEVASGMEEAFAIMEQANFDPAHVAVIEGDLPKTQLAVLTNGQGTGDSTVQITDYQDDQVTIRVETQLPGLLVLSDTYYPGWKAYVDGQQTPIYPTDVALRSVYLEAGEHEVRFVYSPASFKLGVLISGLSLLALVAYTGRGTAWRLWVRLRERRRRGQGGEDAVG
ncbi:MAG: YfhO family protein, partial [Dehalococcoidia bacterium]